MQVDFLLACLIVDDRRIASPELLPKVSSLPHLYCSFSDAGRWRANSDLIRPGIERSRYRGGSARSLEEPFV